MLYLQQSGSPANTTNKNKHGFGIKYIVRYENTPSDINDITKLNGNAINRVKKRKEKDYSQVIFTLRRRTDYREYRRHTNFRQL